MHETHENALEIGDRESQERLKRMFEEHKMKMQLQ